MTPVPSSSGMPRSGFRVQLINPPGLVNSHSLGTLTPCLPLGLAYVAASLEKAGFPVTVLDAVAEAPERSETQGRYLRLGLSIPEVLQRLDPQSFVLGISVTFSFLWPQTRELIREIRKLRPELKIVGGGEHFTALTEHSMREAPLDFIVRGEGEETAVELITALSEKRLDFENIPGIAWRDRDTIRINPSRPRIRAVDDLPPPAWHLFNLAAYEKAKLVNGLHKGITLPILATRGCPYECTYCTSPGMWTQLWLPRDPVRVVDEIESYVHRYGASNFPFQDLTTIIRKDWIVTFCQEILRRNLKIIWQFPSGTRCEAVDEEVASLLFRSGGKHIAFAPESGSEETRRRIKKRMSSDALLSAVRAAAAQGLNITALFILGFPEDTRRDILETARLARTLALEGVEDLGIGFFFPLPNTQIYRELALQKRIELTDDFLRLPLRCIEAALTQEDCYSSNLSARELVFLKIWILLNFYPLAFLRRPMRVLKIFTNFLSSREDSKLESFLLEIKRRIRLALARNKQAFASGSRPGQS